MLTDMETEPQTQTRSDARPRHRAAQACRRCHEKRVKCDASERGTPCTRCEQRREPECKLIQSRRGIYVRKPRRQPQRSSNTRPTQDEGAGGTIANHSRSNDNNSINTQLEPPSGSVITTGSLSSTAVPAVADDVDTHNCQQRDPVPQSMDTRNTPSNRGGLSVEHENHSLMANSSNTSYRDVSWATTFNRLLEHYRNAEVSLDKCSITYVGEAFPLGLVMKDLRGTERPLLHHAGPLNPTEDSAQSSRLSHPSSMYPEDIAFLEAKKAFNAPSDEMVDALIEVFLKRVFPLYPIVNPQELILQHKSRRIPWILLHALCFISATFCSIRILHRAGFDDRTQARYLYYSKAKALFDIGYERNKVIALQVAILMSFWGGGSNNYWNFYTWICTGVTIAETLGFHRSIVDINIKPQDRSLIKRLWWILVIRDATCAALVGRPFRVNLDHCDIETLTEDDFQYNTSSSSSSSLDHLTSSFTQYSGLYQIHATKLALILRHIITTRFYPRNQTAFADSSLQEMLTNWRRELPAELGWSNHSGSHSNVFASTLCILYHHNMILSHVNPSLESGPNNMEGFSPQLFLGEEISSCSAQQIASTAASLVTDSESPRPPHEFFHGLFIASVIFYMQTKSRNQTMVRLGMSGLNNCKMALHANRDTWDAGPWITQLFEKALCSSALDSGLGAEDTNLHTMNTDAEDISNDFATFDANEPFLPGYDKWPNHLFLGNLFDVPTSSTFSMPRTDGVGDSSEQIPWV